ncbi:MAG: hypothetical protein QMB62_05435 [Oscillospiraceae bacterium]
MAKYRKMLSDWEAPYIQSLVKLVETQSKTTLADWCIDYSELRLLPIYEATYPDDLRPRKALIASRDWLNGNIKLPQAKAYILECHAAAREAETNPAAQAAARAIGQSASAIHSASHCVGLALYGALSVAYDSAGIDTDWRELERLAAEECGRMEAALLATAVENEQNPAKMTWQC